MKNPWSSFKSLLGRITGISTPIFGISWSRSETPVPNAHLSADVRVRLVGPTGSARFHIVNIGDATAHDVNFELELNEGQENPLVRGDYNEKLPIVVLRTGDRIEFLAALTLGSGGVFNARWRWRDENGNQTDRAEKVSLQSL